MICCVGIETSPGAAGWELGTNFINSLPWVPSLATSTNCPFKTASGVGFDDAGAGVDVVDQIGPGRRPVTLPELIAMRPVIGGEIEDAVSDQAGRRNLYREFV